MGTELWSIVNSVIKVLKSNGFTIATSEQCTCGLLGASIVSKGEEVYKGTITAYNNGSITKLLGVPSYVIEKNGIISSQVAQQMAMDVLYKFCTNIGVGVIGHIDEGIIDVQICVAKMYKGSMSFEYQKMFKSGGSKGENIEAVIKQTLMVILGHINTE